MLFIDLSSAFNTIIPQHLTRKLSLLGMNTSLCNWILDFLTGNNTSSTTTLSTGAPQGLCAQSTAVHTPDPQEWALQDSNHIIKFVDDATMVGLIDKNNVSSYREEVEQLITFSEVNNLSLKIEKTKEMVGDFRRTQRDHKLLTSTVPCWRSGRTPKSERRT